MGELIVRQYNSARILRYSTLMTAPLTSMNLPPSGQQFDWEELPPGADSLTIAEFAENNSLLSLVITRDSPSAQRVEEELRFFLGAETNTEVLLFPDWETLPYDPFSPHQDIISQRLRTLYQLPSARKAVLVIPATTAIQKLPPRQYVAASTLLLSVEEQIGPDNLRAQLATAGYRLVDTVYEHGEYAIRGALIDVYPMGGEHPYRIEFFDDSVESICALDPENQRSLERCDRMEVLPAREFPLDKGGIRRFRERWHDRFEVDHSKCPVYQDVSQGIAPAGIEYFLPLFFDTLTNLFDYLPQDCVVFTESSLHSQLTEAWRVIEERHSEANIDARRPILDPGELFVRTPEFNQAVSAQPRINLHAGNDGKQKTQARFGCKPGAALEIDARASTPAATRSPTFTAIVGFIPT